MQLFQKRGSLTPVRREGERMAGTGGKRQLFPHSQSKIRGLWTPSTAGRLLERWLQGRSNGFLIGWVEPSGRASGAQHLLVPLPLPAASERASFGRCWRGLPSLSGSPAPVMPLPRPFEIPRQRWGHFFAFLCRRSPGRSAPFERTEWMKRQNSD